MQVRRNSAQIHGHAGARLTVAAVPLHEWINRALPAFWLTLICLGLTACGGSGSGAPDEPVEPPGRPSISYDPAKTTFTSDRAQATLLSRLTLTLHNATTNGLVFFGAFTKVAITGVDANLGAPTTITLTIHHRPPRTLFNGTYTDQLTLNACRDQACNQPLDGSPLSITITYMVTGTDPVTGETGPPPDSEAPLPVASRVVLSHDARDAEYSRTLDRIVMAATYPGNALYIYDVATGTEQSVPLAEPPTSVSISPDGLTAAVGHDALISIVDLAQVGQQNAPGPLLLNVSTKVFDIVLDGRGRVHYIPDTDEGASIHTIDIAAGTEQLSTDPGVFGQTYARLHPSGSYLFVGDPLLSPASMDKWDITGPAAEYVTSASFDSSYLGACGKIWFNESGSQVYSQCGQVFGTDSPQNVHLPFVGRIGLSGPELTNDAYTIAWMDQFAARNEIALIESNAAWCNAPEFSIVCYPRFGIFDSDLLTRHTIHSIAPITVDGTVYGQHALFVFYKSDGSRKFLLSRLDAMSNPDTEYYLSVLE